MICKEFRYDLDKIIHATPEEISSVEGIGPVIAGTFTEYFSDEGNIKRLGHLLSHLTFEEVKTESTQSLEGKQFVITGSVEHFANRKELQELIESKGTTERIYRREGRQGYGECNFQDRLPDQQ